MDHLPVETPDRAIVLRIRRTRRKEGGYEGRIGPVEQARRRAMVLSGHELFPVVSRLPLEIRPRIADEVPKDVRLEISLGVWLVATEPIQRCQQMRVRLGSAAVNSGVAPTPGNRVGFFRRHAIDQFAERAYVDDMNGHGGGLCNHSATSFPRCLHLHERRPFFSTWTER